MGGVREGADNEVSSYKELQVEGERKKLVCQQECGSVISRSVDMASRGVWMWVRLSAAGVSGVVWVWQQERGS